MFDATTLLFIVGVFLIAGTVKGVIGLGLPTISLALLAITMELPGAMALLLIPSFVTNLWQALVGDATKTTFLRIWPFLLMAAVTVWLGASALTRVDLDFLSALLGLLLVVYALFSLAGVHAAIPPRHEIWVGPLAGTINGILTGMTGSFVVPGVLYLQAMGLPRDSLVQAMGMLFTVSTFALAAALQGNGLLTVELGILSSAGLIPAMIGMVLGQRVRRKISDKQFRRAFFASLFVLGFYISATALQDVF